MIVMVILLLLLLMGSSPDVENSFTDASSAEASGFLRLGMGCRGQSRFCLEWGQRFWRWDQPENHENPASSD